MLSYEIKFHYGSVFKSNCSGIGVVFFTGGLAVTAGSMINDFILSSQRSVENYNRRNQGQAGLSILPWLEVNSVSPGFTMNVTFYNNSHSVVKKCHNLRTIE